MFREVWASIRPLIFAGWVVVLVRMTLELCDLSNLTTFSFGIYGGMIAMIAFIGFQGVYDHLLWKKWMVASLMFGVLVVGIPNCISYTTASIQDYNKGRFYYDTEWNDLKSSLMKDEELNEDKASKLTTERLGRTDKTRGPAHTPGDPMQGLLNGLTVGGITTLVGTVGAFLLGAVFIGLGRMRRRGARTT